VVFLIARPTDPCTSIFAPVPALPQSDLQFVLGSFSLWTAKKGLSQYLVPLFFLASFLTSSLFDFPKAARQDFSLLFCAYSFSKAFSF
jgi:hypothetical protein